MNKTPISILQELLVQRKKTTPDYSIENCDIVPGAKFKCTVKFDQFCAFGYGANKKEAKHRSAQEALKLLGWNLFPTKQLLALPAPPMSNVQQSFNNGSSNINYIGKLNEYASSIRKPYPTYVDDIVEGSYGSFVTYCDFLNLQTRGYGQNKKDSKQEAARNMLEKLKTEDVSLITARMEQLDMERVKKIDNLNVEILRKYEAMSGLIAEPHPPVETNPFLNVKIAVKTSEEFKKELLKYDVKYTIETFQSNPYIMMMKLTGTSAVIMGKGNTKTEALNDLYETALLMFQEGFTI